MQRGAADQIIAETGGQLEDAAAAELGKKQKKTRTGREQETMSKKPLGQILYESVPQTILCFFMSNAVH